MPNSLMLKCKICGFEEEIIEMSFEYYMLNYFIPNGIDEICGSCGEESMVPVEMVTTNYCKHCGVNFCDQCYESFKLIEKKPLL